MGNLLVICGPTATGKTKLAFSLAKKFKGELVSADSRQIYKGMNIGTGKDLPKNAKYQMLNDKLGFACPLKPRRRRGSWDLGFYLFNDIRVWGYDLVEPAEKFSVAQYIGFAGSVIQNIQKRKKLPILVGGTGLYIKGVVEGIPTAIVPKSISLRNKYKNRTVYELQEILNDFDRLKLTLMNNSDKNNPRRLIRAIEVAEYKSKYKLKDVSEQRGKLDYRILSIGLTAPREILNRRIKERVKERVRQGIISEMKKLLVKGVRWDAQSMQSLGYRQWRKYLQKSANSPKFLRESVILDWTSAEIAYAKRQMTWFKKDAAISWFTVSDSNYQSDIEKIVNLWYSKSNGKS